MPRRRNYCRCRRSWRVWARGPLQVRGCGEEAIGAASRRRRRSQVETSATKLACKHTVTFTTCNNIILHPELQLWYKIYLYLTSYKYAIIFLIFPIYQSPEFCVCCSDDVLWWILRCSRSIHVMFYNMALFAFLIIRTFQLIFSAETVFFSHNRSAEIMFRLVFSAKRTGPIFCNVHIHTTVTWICVCCSGDVWWCSRSVHVIFYDIFYNVCIVCTWCSMAVACRKVYISDTWNIANPYFSNATMQYADEFFYYFSEHFNSLSR